MVNQPLLDSTGVENYKLKSVVSQPQIDRKNGDANTTEQKSGEPTTDTTYQTNQSYLADLLATL